MKRENERRGHRDRLKERGEKKLKREEKEEWSIKKDLS